MLHQNASPINHVSVKGSLPYNINYFAERCMKMCQDPTRYAFERLVRYRCRVRLEYVCLAQLLDTPFKSHDSHHEDIYLLLALLSRNSTITQLTCHECTQTRREPQYSALRLSKLLNTLRKRQRICQIEVIGRRTVCI